MEEKAQYVTFGDPEFEKDERKGGFFRKFLSKFKMYDDAPTQQPSFLPSVDSVSIGGEPFDILSSNRTKSSDAWSDTMSAQELNVIAPRTALPPPSSSHGTNTAAVRRLHLPFYLNAAANSSLADAKLSADRRYWMLDESCRHCFECGCRFNTIRRRHHCRVCGRIFCHQCSNQFVEGQQIGMSGLQRVCNYCAHSLPSTSPIALPRVGSTKQLNRYGPREDHSTGVHEISTSSQSSLDTTLCRATVDEEHNTTGAVHLGSNAEDLLGFGRLLSPSGLRKHAVAVPTIPSGSSGNTRLNRVRSAHVRSSGCSTALPNPPYSIATGSRATCDVSVMTSSADLLPNVCSDETHRHEKLDDNQIRELWSQMVSSYLTHRSDNPPQRVNSSAQRLDTESFELTDRLGLNPRILQLVTVAHNEKTIYCVSGLSLVYWLASNIPEVQRCRDMARPICQRFMDLSLLIPLNGPAHQEFRDDFTPYEVRQMGPILMDSPQKGDRRLSWPPCTGFRLSSSSSRFANFGLDEPDWLREIVDEDAFEFLDADTKSDRMTEENGTAESTSTHSAPTGSIGHPLPDVPSDLRFPGELSSAELLERRTSPSFEIGEDVRLMNYVTEDSTPLPPAAPSSGLKTILSLYGSETDVSSNPTFARTRTSTVLAKSLPKQLVGNAEFGPNVKKAFNLHIQRFVLQDARDNHLDSNWVSVLIDLAHAVCNLVSFDIRSTGLRSAANPATENNSDSNSAGGPPRPVYSAMDIRYYVHIKKLLDRSSRGSDIFPGVVFTKRAAHKFMPNMLNEPRILLLATSIDYQRMPSKITWLESQIMQEEEYLSNCVSKLLALRPKVIIAGGSVSHVAQTLLLKAGITLFCNVKRSVLLRIARITGADILESVDRLISTNTSKTSNPQRVNTPQLGVSQQLKVEQAVLSNGYSKFLTLIKNASRDSSIDPSSSRYTTAEATVLLRGPDLATLNRAKRCLRFALFLCYNSRLEQSYAANAFIYHPITTRSIGLYSDCTGVHQRQASNGNSTTPGPDDMTKPDDPDQSNVDSNPLRLTTLLANRLFDLSPSVVVPPPFLASADGQVAPLAAYYTYVIEWPFGRRLNDLLKRKFKVLRSETYALDQMKRLQKSQPIDLPTWSEIVITERPEFLTRNLKFQSTELLTLLTNSPSKRIQLHNSGVMDKTVNLNALLMSETLQPEDETAYVMFKARAVSTPYENSPAPRNVSRRKFWNDLKELMCVEKDALKSIRESMLGSVQQLHQQQSQSNKTITNKPPATSEAAPVVSRNETQQVKRLQRSILDPRSQQWFSFLTTLFSFRSPLWPEPCVPPWIASVEYYGPQDLPLGLFLEKCCFSQQPCRHPHCNWPMSDHMQPFVQTSGAVQLYIRKLPQDPPRPTPNLMDSSTRPDSRILMWLACTICGNSSPTVYMSGDTWHYSFVKFLDLLINTPSEWGRCAMRTPMTDSRTTSPNDSTVCLRSDDVGSSTGTGYQLSCPHSAHKALQHCFSFDRKVAVFRYQPTTVYELVMPPNEIYIHPSPSQAAICRLSSSTATGDLDRPVQSTPSVSSRTETPRRLLNSDSRNVHVEIPIPPYLRSEALEILEKYYHTYAAVKAHLITLQQDNVNPEFSPLLQSYIHLLQTHSRRNHMEVRAELLAHLVNTTSAKVKHPVTSTNVPSSAPQSSTASVRQPSRLVEEDVKSIQSTDAVRESADSHKAVELWLSDDEAVQPPILRVKVGASSETPEAGAQGKSVTSTPAEDDQDESVVVEDYSATWSALLATVPLAERCFIVQSLINDLKRWIYGFVVCWNSKCMEYEAQVKRAEKQAKESRKKLTSTASTTNGGAQSPSIQVKQTESRATSSSELDRNRVVRTVSSSGCFHTLPSVGHTPDLLSRTSALATDAAQYSNETSINHDTLLSVTGNESVNQRVCSNRAVTISPDPSSEQSLDFLMLSDEPLANSLLPSGRGGTLDSQDILSMSTQDEEEEDQDATKLTVTANSRNKLLNALPILDPINLKVIYSPLESNQSASSPASPAPPRKPSLSKGTEATVLAAASAATVPLNAPSGVRRFIHTLLPSNNDSKVFSDPFPPHEHPQLSLVGEIGSSFFQRSRRTSALVENGDRDPRTLDYKQNLIQHLRLAPPDVYVNDRELTSIVAYALSTTEYERHLVDLHADANNRNSASNSFQMGQSALSEFGSNSKDTLSPAPNQSRCGDLDKVSSNMLQVPVHSSNQSIKEEGVKGRHSSTSLVSPTINASSKSPSAVQSPSPAPNLPVGSLASTGPVPVPGEKVTQPISNRHIKIQFSDSTTNFFCCVYYASEFFRLRQLLLPQGDISFIRSLSRCFQWNARGGKSGSLFMKTCDERFVVKELSGIEMRTFHEISQQYFDYLIGAALEQRLCVLSRILGIFHVGFKNSLSGEAHRFDVLVMENLFFDRTQLAFIYDLKGSLRKRLVDETSAFKTPMDVAVATGRHLVDTRQSRSDTGTSQQHAAETGRDQTVFPYLTHKKSVPVLLDQNLLNASVDGPLYLRVHSKNALSHCLLVDSNFLADLFLMDYSLLVGVDPSTNQLVIGLIDYLRKFTFDKRMEMMIKQTISSAQAPPPTILTPDLYRERFLVQMDSYFPLVPDQWYDSLAEHVEAWRVQTKPTTSPIHQSDILNSDQTTATAKPNT